VLPPVHCPPRIRTDDSNPFAHHTLSVRVPAIVNEAIERNPDYAPEVRAALTALARAQTENRALPEIESAGPGADGWRAALHARAGESWLRTDWFFAETYAYRQLVDRVGFWVDGRDPFLPNKREEYASPAHSEALERALGLRLSREERLHALLGAALFGNRIDLSFAPSREHGTGVGADDLLTDERELAVSLVMRGSGPVHVICDNAGTELSCDLALADFVLSELGAEVVLHVKAHPTFVSDAIEHDVLRFLGRAERERDFEITLPRDGAAMVARLAAAHASGQMRLSSHLFWNGPESLWDLPEELAQGFASARLVVLKGDANYRRAVGDAVWPPSTPFRDVAAYFPAPLLALRTLKSDPVVGLRPGQAEELDRVDARWRVNGKRGVASLGGAGA
jgi:hypothetical protein